MDPKIIIEPRWLLLIVAFLLFVLMSQPAMYDLTGLTMPTNIFGMPTNLGIFLHGLIFTILLFLFAKFSKAVEYLKEEGKDMYEDTMVEGEEEQNVEEMI